MLRAKETGSTIIRLTTIAVLLQLCLGGWAAPIGFSTFNASFEPAEKDRWQSFYQTIEPERWQAERTKAMELPVADFMGLPGVAGALKRVGLETPERVFCGVKAALGAGVSGYSVTLEYPNRKVAGGQQWQLTSRILLVKPDGQERIVQAVELHRYEAFAVDYELSRAATYRISSRVMDLERDGRLEIVSSSVRSRSRGKVADPSHRLSTLLK